MVLYENDGSFIWITRVTCNCFVLCYIANYKRTELQVIRFDK